MLPGMPLEPPPSLSARDIAAIDACAKAEAAKVPPLPLEVIARLRPIFAAVLVEEDSDASH